MLSKESCKYTYINGLVLKNDKSVTLQANDRIIFGTGSAFLFRNEDNAAKSAVQDTKENPVTHEFAMEEKIANDDKEESARKAVEKQLQEAETAAKLAALDMKMQLERQA